MNPLKLKSQKPVRLFLNKNFVSGFSLVEITLALLIFVVGFMALFTLINSYIYTIKTTKERISANFLAQEGLELVLAKRNSNFVSLNDSDLLNNKEWLDGLLIGEFCINPDLSVSAIDNCDNGKIYIDSSDNVFTHKQNDNSNPNLIQTIFSRIIKITPIQENDKGVLVESKVLWKGNPVILNLIITKWHPLAE